MNLEKTGEDIEVVTGLKGEKEDLVIVAEQGVVIGTETTQVIAFKRTIGEVGEGI